MHVTMSYSFSVPSAAPVLDSAEAVSTTLISIHWLPPPSIHINGMLQYYFVNVTEVNTGKKWTFIAVDSSLMIGSLHPYYMYNYSITARTIGNGPYSPVQSVRTLEDGKDNYVCTAQLYMFISSDLLQEILVSFNNFIHTCISEL